MRTDIPERRKEIEQWIANSQTKTYICKQLKCKAATLNSWLAKMGIDYRGNQGGKGVKRNPKRKTAYEYSQSTNCVSNRLKRKLLEDKIKDKKCEQCNLEVWNYKPIPLELHHIDGNRFNNEFANLQILCPNCHAQTPNYAGKGMKRN